MPGGQEELPEHPKTIAKGRGKKEDSPQEGNSV